MSVVRHCGSRSLRIFQVNGVELAVVSIIGVEGETNEPICKSMFGRKLVKQSWVLVAPIEIQVRGEMGVGPVEDIERTVQIVHEEPLFPASARLFPYEIDPRKQAFNFPFAVDGAGHWHRSEIANVKFQARRI